MVSLARFLIGLTLFSGTTVWAAQADSVSVGERWSVVGVIAGDSAQGKEATGIAVLRNNLTQRSYTLSIGDPIPTEYGFVLQKVLPRSVQIVKDREVVTLGFAEAVTESVAPQQAEEDPSGRAARFLESYYRAFESGEPMADDLSLDDAEASPIFVPHINVTRGLRAGRLGGLSPTPTKNNDEPEEDED